MNRFSMSTLLSRSGNETHISAVYLHGEGVSLDFAIKTTAQVAQWVLQIAYLIYPAKMDLSGIRIDLDQIMTRY